MGGGEKGGEGGRLGGASAGCHRVSRRPLRPPPEVRERGAERGRGLGARGRGSAGSLRAARHPERAGRLSSARSPEPGAGRPPSTPALCALGRSPGRGSQAPGERAPPWSLRTKMPRRRRRPRTPGGRPPPAGWWCRSARRRAPCAPPSPTCPFRWPSSASSSTLSCRDWVRRGGRDPCVPGPVAEGRARRGRGETLGERPRAASASAGPPSRRPVAGGGRAWSGRPRGWRGAEPPARLSPSPTCEPGCPAQKSQKLCWENWSTRAAAGMAPPGPAGLPSRRPETLPLLSATHPPSSPLF